jgi:hypothetical protein
VTCRGIEGGPLAWTGEVHGEVMIGRLRLPFASTTSATTGAVLELEVETDPPRPQLAGVVRAADGPAPARVPVGALTDAGSFEDVVPVAADGKMIAAFDEQWLAGTVLHRFWVDGLDAAAGSAASGERQLPLHNGRISLGELVLAPHAPVLRGRVVDSRGLPLPDAQVVVQAATAEAPTTSVPVALDRDGRFALVGPQFRDARGAPAPVVATATVARP